MAFAPKRTEKVEIFAACTRVMQPLRVSIVCFRLNSAFIIPTLQFQDLCGLRNWASRAASIRVDPNSTDVPPKS